MEYLELVEKTKECFNGEEEKEEKIVSFLECILNGTRREGMSWEQKLLFSLFMYFNDNETMRHNALLNQIIKPVSGRREDLISQNLELINKLKKDLERHFRWLEKVKQSFSEKRVDLKQKETRVFIVADYIRFLSLHSTRPSFNEDKEFNELEDLPQRTFVPSLGISFVWKANIFSHSYQKICSILNTNITYSEIFDGVVLEQNEKEISLTNERFKSLCGHKMEEILTFKPIELPELRGLRVTLLKQFFKHMSGYETLKMSLVCKEWKKSARSETVWRSHLERDLSRWRQEYPKASSFLESQKIEGKKSFQEYWNVKTKLWELVAPMFDRSMKWKECGIAVSVREPTTDSESAVDTVEHEEISGREKGCCHDAVAQIARGLFEEDSLNSLMKLNLGRGEGRVEEEKEKMSSEVSLKCMKRAMNHIEIRGELVDLIFERFFSK